MIHNVQDLQTLDRYINEHFSMTSHTTAWQNEGNPLWDCKGFSALKIDALIEAGISPSDITVLIVPGSPAHMVVKVHLKNTDKNYVLDSNSPWLQNPEDYYIINTAEAWTVRALIPQAQAAIDAQKSKDSFFMDVLTVN